MHKTLLTFALATAIAGAMAFSASPAFAKYGYQCFKTISRDHYCSCTKFKNHEEGNAWIKSKLAELQAAGKTGDDLAVKGRPTVEPAQPDPCAD